MRRYETTFILRPSQSEDEITTIIENTKKIILDEKGSIISLSRWGIKKLAYTIKKEIQGQYVFCDYAGTPAAVAEIERKFRIDDAVLKYLTIKTTDTISEEEIQNAITEAATKSADSKENSDDDENGFVDEGSLEERDPVEEE